MTTRSLQLTQAREARKDTGRTSEKRMVRSKVECRALTDKEKADGYIGAMVGVIPFNSDSRTVRDRRLNGGRPFVEQIAPRAFESATEVMALAGHSDATLDAFARQGVNLTITESDRELRWDALIPDTTAGRDLLKLGQLGIINGTSFEFDYGAEDKWEKRSDGTDVRIVTKGTLATVNPVVWPAYDDSALSVSMRGQRGRDGNEGPEAVEIRGCYLRPDGGPVDYYDPTITADSKFAGAALSRATYALTDALEYLRAVEAAPAKAGALADYARAELAAASANAKSLIDWLASNGATVAPEAMKRAEAKLTEARTAAGLENISSPQPSARERALRILT